LGDPERALTALERYKELTGEDRPVTSWIAELRQRTGKPPVKPAAQPPPGAADAGAATPQAPPAGAATPQAPPAGPAAAPPAPHDSSASGASQDEKPKPESGR